MKSSFLNLLRHLYRHRAVQRVIVDLFHLLYYDGSIITPKAWQTTSWMGILTLKCPFDLWVFQEIIHETQPDVIIECGTFRGGSTLYLASVCDLIGKGRIISIDLEVFEERPVHPRITYLQGSSIEDKIIAQVKNLIQAGNQVMAILDSEHKKAHVLQELNIYKHLVSPGHYLIVEDTNINGHPVLPQYGPGPGEAVKEFLAANPNFQVDPSREKLYLTFNPGGYLRKIT